MTLSACSTVATEPTHKTVSDNSGRYEILIPEEWTGVSDASILAVYATEELPTAEAALETLSILVFDAPQMEESGPDKMLVEFVELRSEDRQWQDAEISEPSIVTVGGRPGHAVDVTATDADGTRFTGRFVAVRTAGTDVVAIVVAPADEFDEYADEIDNITESWSWGVPDDAAETTN